MITTHLSKIRAIIFLVQYDRLLKGGRLALSCLLQRGGEADGGLSGVDVDVHVRHVHPRSAFIPQKEVDRP